MIKVFPTDKNKTSANEKMNSTLELKRQKCFTIDVELSGKWLGIIIYFEYRFSNLQLSVLMLVFKNIISALILLQEYFHFFFSHFAVGTCILLQVLCCEFERKNSLQVLKIARGCVFLNPNRIRTMHVPDVYTQWKLTEAVLW